MDVSPERLVEQANERFQLQDYYGAIHLLEEVIATGRAFADAHHLLGLSYSLAGQPDKALEQLDRALVLNPNYIEALIHRALVLNELGREEEANAMLRRARQVTSERRGGFHGHVAAKLANLHAALGQAYIDSTRPRSRWGRRFTTCATSWDDSCSRRDARWTRTSIFRSSSASGPHFSTRRRCWVSRTISRATGWRRARYGRSCGLGGPRIRGSKPIWRSCRAPTSRQFPRERMPPPPARPTRYERRKRSETVLAGCAGDSAGLHPFRCQP